MYLDRMIGFDRKPSSLSCPACGETLGVLTIYKKERRPAYRLFVGAVVKKIVSAQEMKKSDP